MEDRRNHISIINPDDEDWQHYIARAVDKGLGDNHAKAENLCSILTDFASDIIMLTEAQWHAHDTLSTMQKITCKESSHLNAGKELFLEAAQTLVDADIDQESAYKMLGITLGEALKYYCDITQRDQPSIVPHMPLEQVFPDFSQVDGSTSPTKNNDNHLR